MSKTNPSAKSEQEPEQAKGPGFEESLQTLEQLTLRLESGNLGLDAALAAYEQGIRTLSQCHQLLAHAERKVEMLMQVDVTNPEGPRWETVPFQAEATFSASAPPTRTSGQVPLLPNPDPSTAVKPASPSRKRKPNPDPDDIPY